MGQDSFDKLCTELQHCIVKRDTRFCVAVTLWKLATNVEYRTLTQLMGIGRSTACQIVNSVCEAITCIFCQDSLVFPLMRYKYKKLWTGLREKRGSPR